MLLGNPIQVGQRYRVAGLARRRQGRVQRGISKTTDVLPDKRGGTDSIAVVKDVKPVRGVGVPITTAQELEITGVSPFSQLCQWQHVNGQFEADFFQVGLYGHRHAAGISTGLVGRQPRRQTLAVLDPITFAITLLPTGAVEQTIGFPHVVGQYVFEVRGVVTGVGGQKIAFGLVFTKPGDPGQPVTINRLGHRPAYHHVLKRKFLNVVRQAAKRIALANAGVHLQLRVVANGLRILCGGIDGKIRLPRFQGAKADHRLGNNAHLQTIEVGLALMPGDRRRPVIALALDEGEALIAGVTFEHKRPRTDGMLGNGFRRLSHLARRQHAQVRLRQHVEKR